MNARISCLKAKLDVAKYPIKYKETDFRRIHVLEKVAQTCRWVPANPARNFYESLQAFRFTFIPINPSTTANTYRRRSHIMRF